MRGKDVREALRGGRMVYSTALVALSTKWPGALKSAGVDFAFIDTEHTPLDRESISWMCHAFAALDIPPVVRIPSPDPFEASKVLDGGAGGIIAPYIESAEQVRQLMGVVRYRPLKGGRLQDALHNPATLEPELRTYLDERNAQTIFIANIESVPAINKLDEILAVGAIDSVLIGPHDLSCSLGIPEQYNHPRFAEAVKTIFQKARAHNCGAGIHYWEGVGQELDWARAGGNLMMHAADLSLFSQRLQRELKELRAALGDSGAQSKAGSTDII